MMSRVRTRHTAPEVEVRKILHRLGYRFRLHVRELPGCPDIVLPRLGAVIFVHGCFWHHHRCSRGKVPSSNTAFWSKKLQRNKKRDSQARQQLAREGWRVKVIWQCELRNPEGLITKLKSFLSK